MREPFMKTAVLGYPRIGKNRELKKAVEGHWKGDIGEALEEATKVTHDPSLSGTSGAVRGARTGQRTTTRSSRARWRSTSHRAPGLHHGLGPGR